MKKRILAVLVLSLVISGCGVFTSEASSNKKDTTITTNQDNSYFTFKNIWGGEALKLEFDESTMKIKAISRSGNFGNSDNNFTFKLIDSKTKETIVEESADTKYVRDFIAKINEKSFEYDNIIALNINSSSGLSSPTLYSKGKTETTNCVGKTQYLQITDKGIVKYVPDIKISPIKILGQGTVKNTTIRGTTTPNCKIKVKVEGSEFLTTSDSNGEFSLEIESKSGFTAHTAIEVSVGEIKVIVYPELSSNKNMKQQTNTGYSYILNADIETLTTPFDKDVVYGRSILSESGKKAWDVASKSLLKFDNTEDKYPRDSAGNVEFYVDYESHNIKINATDAQYIQNYLVRSDARMYLLKDWGAKPVYKDGVIVGQNFYIGNSAQNGNNYQQQLLQIEESVSYLLSKITPDMSVYQIIKTLQVEYEAMVSYVNAGPCGDLRGPFIEKKAICGGFSKGFEYLLQRVGIETTWVNGFAGGAHAWNYINLYNNWYLADTTWGGKNWYLRSGKDTTNHQVYNTFHVMPTLVEESIPWELGDMGQTIANLTGVVNYENNNDGTIKVTYEDKENINEKMHINTSLDDYKPLEMTKDSEGVWSVDVSLTESEAETLDFYFTVDQKFNTIGNIKANKLTVDTLENGMTNIVLPTFDVSTNSLKELINKCDYKEEDYTKSTFKKYKEALDSAIKVSENENASSLAITKAYKELENAINNLRVVNKIEFKGYKNVVFMTLEFDTENNKFKAVSNGEMIHPYQYSREYVKVQHFDQKGNLKGEYKGIANKTADEMANALNDLSYEKGDYIKLSHLEQNNRLLIKGYVTNAPYDLNTGSKDLDLNNSYFYLGEESLKYSNEQLDLSADKTDLIAKIKEMKEIPSEKYTKTSFENLQNEIKKAEDLVKSSSVLEKEIIDAIQSLEDGKNNLREINEIVFKGYNNNEFLKLSFDSENKSFKAVSNGEVANKFLGGKYAEIVHFDKKGNKKGTYSINGSQNADNIANSLNDVKYRDGDFLKLYHAEQRGRLALKGYIENVPADLSQGVGDLDLNNCVFYLNGENLRYSNEHLDLSADKKQLIEKIEKAKKIQQSDNTKTTYENLQQAILKGEELVNSKNTTEEEVAEEIQNIDDAITNLRKVNKIEFKGYENVVFMTLEFDSENNKFKAVSNGEMIHPYQYSREYVKVQHFDQKGNLKGEYKGIANKTADEMANDLNNLSYENGDYIKLSHLEKNNRLVINGYVTNAPYDLSTGSTNLDLNNSYFYLGEESLKYSNEQLDLSADKTDLIAKVNEVKNISGESYTKSSYENLLNELNEAEKLISSTNVFESEINTAIENLNNAKANLREVNKVEFKGYNNVVFLSLEFDKENNKFKATSNGKMVHDYHGSKVYTTVYHYDKDNNLKGEYSVRANETADNMANALNEASISAGDYLKFGHIEQNGRLAIKGYVNNLDSNISNGVGSLDLNRSMFNLDDENLTYIATN